MTAKLAEFDKQVGNLRVTRYGISEIITAKACPNSRTNYFPSINSMKIRLSRGHHLFDDVEPVWPEELSAPATAASPAQTSKYLPDGRRAKAVRKGAKRSKKHGQVVSEAAPLNSKAAIIAAMIAELEQLAAQLAVTQLVMTTNVEVSEPGEAVIINQAGKKNPGGQMLENNRLNGHRRLPTARTSQRIPAQETPAPKRQSAPPPGSYPSLLFNSTPVASNKEKTRTTTVRRTAEADITAWMRRNPLARQNSSASHHNKSHRENHKHTPAAGVDTAVCPSAGSAFDQLCNLVNSKYQQCNPSPDKRSVKRRRQLLKELEAVNETLFSFA